MTWAKTFSPAAKRLSIIDVAEKGVTLVNISLIILTVW